MFRPLRYFTGFLLASILIFSACKKDPEIPTGPVVRYTPLKLTIKPVWNGAPFNSATNYQTPAGNEVNINLVKFYLAHFTLANEQGEDRIFDADLFDVTNGPVTRVLRTSMGHAHNLRFGLGLPPEINHIALNTIPPNAPTGNNSGMYWSWGFMYRFVLFEGHFDTIPGNMGQLPFNFSIHTGFDTCYRRRSIPIDLQADADDTARLTLLVDISRFFTNGTDTLDLTQGAQWHGDVDTLGGVINIDLVIKLANLQSAAFSVE